MTKILKSLSITLLITALLAMTLPAYADTSEPSREGPMLLSEEADPTDETGSEGDEPAAPFVGSGTEKDPYLIQTADDLVTLGDLTDMGDSEYDVYRSAYYKLTADIDMNGVDFHGLCRRATKTVENGETKYIYNSKGQVFSGVINGNYHIISNMTIDNHTKFFKSDGSKPSVYEALIVFGGGCTIKNLGLVSPKVNGTSKSTGAGFVALCNDAVTLENCFVKSISYIAQQPKTYAAFIGQIADDSIIKNCYSTTNGVADHRGSEPEGVKVTNVYVKSGLRSWAIANNYLKVQNLSGADLTTAVNNFVAAAGKAFVLDTDGVNSGYPLLKWETERVTEDGTMIISDFEADSDASFGIVIKNCNPGSMTGVAAVVFYGADSEMLGAKVYGDISLESGEAFDDTGSLSSISDAVGAKLFLWDSLADMQFYDFFECEFVSE